MHYVLTNMLDCSTVAMHMHFTTLIAHIPCLDSFIPLLYPL